MENTSEIERMMEGMRVGGELWILVIGRPERLKINPKESKAPNFEGKVADGLKNMVTNRQDEYKAVR
ncbi:hypothetical protein GB937_006842 [Aspergillus fischeri]|nr:hypothetical protein GB937_006842 [Aspergillus fischeri]